MLIRTLRATRVGWADSTGASASTAKASPFTSLINALRALIFDQASTPFKERQ